MRHLELFSDALFGVLIHYGCIKNPDYAKLQNAWNELE